MGQALKKRRRCKERRIHNIGPGAFSIKKTPIAQEIPYYNPLQIHVQ
jgi:hypothetical protein